MLFYYFSAKIFKDSITTEDTPSKESKGVTDNKAVEKVLNTVTL